MRKDCWIVSICIVLALLFVECLDHGLIYGPGEPLAARGVLDLTYWDQKANPHVFLRGEWEFYWKQLLDPSDFLESPSMTGFIGLPSSWNRYELDGERLGPEGYATFALTVLMPGKGERLALNISNVATAYRVFVNEELRLTSGTVGKTPDKMVAHVAPQHIEFEDAGPEIRVVIQASNFLHRKGGLWTDIELGPAQYLGTLDDWRLMIDIGSFGAFAIMGLYHLCLFWQRKRDRSTLYFGLLCLAFAVRTLLVGQVVLARVFPALPWETLISIEYFASSAILPLGAAFTESSYPDETARGVVTASTIGWLAFASIAMTASPKVSVRMALFYEAFDLVICVFIFRALITAVLHKRAGSTAVATGAVVFVAGIFVDMLYNLEVVHFGNLSQVGLVFLVFMQSYSLSVRFSGAFSSVERLSEELTVVNTALTDLNRHLESRVEERTSQVLESNRQLEAMNRDIARMEEARKHLLANIAHDLRTPITLIRGYVEAMLDGIIEGPEAEAKYLRLIESKASGLATLIDDLFELTQLESRRATFNLRPLDVYDVVEKLSQKYEPDIANAGLTPRLHLTGLQGRSPIYVDIDLDQIDRVVSNLIYNAIKFTPKGGWVEVQCSLEDTGETRVTAPKVVIGISDNGSGITESDLPFVFDRFHKSPRSRSSSVGSGLGLSIAKEIVELHGGQIWVRSRYGRGSAFYFSLPTVPPPEGSVE